MELVRLIDGTQLATWRDPGHGDHPPVVFVHGGPGLWDYLEALAALLDGITTGYRFDQRGCGRSTGDGPYSMAGAVSDLHELVQHLELSQLSLVGHSYGAQLAMAYAAQHPERVAAVCYLSGVGIGDWHSAYRAERDARGARFAAELAELSAARHRSPAQLQSSEQPQSPAQEVRWRQLKWATDFADVAAGLELALPMAREPWTINTAANQQIKCTDREQIDWANTIQCPVTVIHGTADPRPLSCAVALAQHFKQARKRVVTEAGHLPWLEQPEQCKELLHEFVQST